MIVACGMPSPQRAPRRPAESLIIGLQTGEHEIDLFILDRRGERASNRVRVGRRQAVRFHVHGTIGAPRQRFPDHLRRPRGSGRADDHLAAVLLLEAQRLLERIRVRLVELEAGVLVANPGPGVVDTELPLARHDLLDAHGYLHAMQIEVLEVAEA